MTERFDNMMLINQASDGLRGVFSSPNLYNPTLIEQLNVSTSGDTANTITSSAVIPIELVNNGWSAAVGTTSYFIYCEDSTKPVAENISLSKADYPIRSLYTASSHTIADLKYLDAATSGQAIFEKTNRYPTKVTTVTINGKTFGFTTQIDGVERDLDNTRITVYNPDASLKTIPQTGVVFIVNGFGSDNNILEATLADVLSDVSEITEANKAKLVISFRGLEDLPKEILAYKSTAVTNVNTIFRITNSA